MQLIDLTGKTFGNLEVISRAPSKKRSTQWFCRCVCGTVKSIAACHLRSGCIKDCGRVHYELGEVHTSWRGSGEIGHRYFQHICLMAKKRNIPMEITLDDMWILFLNQNRKCALSGVPLTFDRKDGRMVGTASLDRIDSSMGYAKGNVQWVHKEINFMKRHLSESQFLEHCKNICKHKKVVV